MNTRGLIARLFLCLVIGFLTAIAAAWTIALWSPIGTVRSASGMVRCITPGQLEVSLSPSTAESWARPFAERARREWVTLRPVPGAEALASIEHYPGSGLEFWVWNSTTGDPTTV